MYKASNSGGSVPLWPQKHPQRGVPIALPDPGELISSYSLPLDLHELSSMPPGQLKFGVLGKVMPVPQSAVSVVASAAEYTPLPTVSSFTILPSVHFQTIPPLPQTPFSVIPSEHIPVFYATGNDLDMTLYVGFSLFWGFHRAGGTKGMFWQPPKGAMSVG